MVAVLAKTKITLELRNLDYFMQPVRLTACKIHWVGLLRNAHQLSMYKWLEHYNLIEMSEFLFRWGKIDAMRRALSVLSRYSDLHQ